MNFQKPGCPHHWQNLQGKSRKFARRYSFSLTDSPSALENFYVKKLILAKKLRAVAQIANLHPMVNHIY